MTKVDKALDDKIYPSNSIKNDQQYNSDIEDRFEKRAREHEKYVKNARYDGYDEVDSQEDYIEKARDSEPVMKPLDDAQVERKRIVHLVQEIHQQ